MNENDKVAAAIVKAGNAIAEAIREHAVEVAKAARALDALGMNNHMPSGPPGVLEKIAMELRDHFARLAAKED
jgi:hypothetical protein